MRILVGKNCEKNSDINGSICCLGIVSNGVRHKFCVKSDNLLEAGAVTVNTETN